MCRKSLWHLIFWHSTCSLWFQQLVISHPQLDIIIQNFWKWVHVYSVIAYLLMSYCMRQDVFPLCYSPYLLLVSAYTIKKQHHYFHFRAHCCFISLHRDFYLVPVWISVPFLNTHFNLMSPARSPLISQFMFLWFIASWRGSHSCKVLQLPLSQILSKKSTSEVFTSGDPHSSNRRSFPLSLTLPKNPNVLQNTSPRILSKRHFPLFLFQILPVVMRLPSTLQLYLSLAQLFKFTLWWAPSGATTPCQVLDGVLQNQSLSPLRQQLVIKQQLWLP